MPSSFPLAWPLGRPRTERRKRSRFDTSPADARDGLLDELRRLGASQIVVSSNVATYVRGGREIMYANQSAAQDDPGVAVYYTWKGEQYALACDRWDRVHDNVQAIRKTVEALRGLDRWGTGEMVRAAFSGFKALPEAGTGEAWWEVLGLTSDASADDVRRAYRQAAHDAHPDRGGSRETWDRLVTAYQMGLAVANRS